MARLIIHSDLECEIYIDTEYHSNTRIGEKLIIELPVGAYWIKCVSIENKDDFLDFDFIATSSDCSELHDVELTPIRYKRLTSQYDYISEFVNGFAEAKKGDAIGYINHKGDLIYDSTTYDRVIPLSNNTVWICKDGLWGILNSNGNYDIEPQYIAINVLSSGPTIFFTGEKYGIINANGEIVVPAKYDDLYKIDGADLICCSLNHKFGILNFQGLKITPLKYDLIKSNEDGFVGVRINDKWGLIDTSGKEIIPCIYDSIGDFSEGLVAVCKNWKWGFADKTGKEVISCIYDKVGCFSEGLAAVCNNWKWGLIDKYGKEIAPCKYANMPKFCENIALVEERIVNVNSKYGFIDRTGKEIVPCQYKYARHFNNGRAIVEIDSKYGFIDEQGALVIPAIYSGVPGRYFIPEIKSFNEGLAAVAIDGKCLGYIDVMGNLVIPCNYDIIKSFCNGYAAFYVNRKWGYINKSGEEVVPPIYDEAEDFGSEIEGLAKVKLDKKWGFINKAGKEIIACKYDEIERLCYTTENLIKVKSMSQWGFIDKLGNEIIPCLYWNIKNFNEGLAAVHHHSAKWGFINKSGKVVIDCIYEEVGNFGVQFPGLSKVKSNDRYGLINKECKEIVPCEYTYIASVPQYPSFMNIPECSFEGLVRVCRNGKWGFIDNTGKEVVACQYTDVGDFNNGVTWVKKGGHLVDSCHGHSYQLKSHTIIGQTSRRAGAPEYCASYGIIDKQGNEIVPCIYDSIVPMGNYFRVGYGGEWIVKEYEKNLTWRTSYNFHRGRLFYIDKSGKEIAEVDNAKYYEHM